MDYEPLVVRGMSDEQKKSSLGILLTRTTGKIKNDTRIRHGTILTTAFLSADKTKLICTEVSTDSYLHPPNK